MQVKDQDVHWTIAPAKSDDLEARSYPNLLSVANVSSNLLYVPL